MSGGLETERDDKDRPDIFFFFLFELASLQCCNVLKELGSLCKQTSKGSARPHKTSQLIPCC